MASLSFSEKWKQNKKHAVLIKTWELSYFNTWNIIFVWNFEWQGENKRRVVWMFKF